MEDRDENDEASPEVQARWVCWSQGSTEAEALANIRDAIREYLQVVDELLSGAEIREIDVAV